MRVHWCTLEAGHAVPRVGSRNKLPGITNARRQRTRRVTSSVTAALLSLPFRITSAAWVSLLVLPRRYNPGRVSYHQCATCATRRRSAAILAGPTFQCSVTRGETDASIWSRCCRLATSGRRTRLSPPTYCTLWISPHTYCFRPTSFHGRRSDRGPYTDLETVYCKYRPFQLGGG